MKRWNYWLPVILISISACYLPRISFQKTQNTNPSGEQFFDSVTGKNTSHREALAESEILGGNIPSFLIKFRKIKFKENLQEKTYRVSIYVLPDYLSVGKKDFARIPLTPHTAQEIADSFHAFLPTKKIVDIIYNHAKIKLRPIPMYAFRDSSVTMYQHHLIIEGQRKLKKGIIAGIKKDVVTTGRLVHNPGKVAIYGWHLLNGKPIQPLYTGHVNWYVDYSHGIRLIYEKIKVNGKWYNFKTLLNDPLLHSLITDEETGSYFRYP